jgi:hypothetical protein
VIRRPVLFGAAGTVPRRGDGGRCPSRLAAELSQRWGDYVDAAWWPEATDSLQQWVVDAVEMAAIERLRGR